MPDQPTEGPQQHLDLLKQILNRLQRMEGGLSQHEDWLRRIEQEYQRPAESPVADNAGRAEPAPPAPIPADELQRLIGSLTLERDRANKSLAEAQRHLGQYQQELAGLRKQAADMQHRLAEHDQRMANLKQITQAERQQTLAAHSEVSRQLEQRQQQLQAMQARLTAAEQEVSARNRQIAELQTALEQAADKFEQLSAQLTARAVQAVTEAGQGRPRLARLAVVLALLTAIASAGLTAWVFQRGQAGMTNTASGMVILPGADAETLRQCALAASRQARDLRVVADPKLGLIEITAQAADGRLAAAAVNQAAQHLMAHLPQPRPVTSSQPASQPEGQNLAARIAETTRRIEASRPTAPDVTGSLDLPARWKALQDERSRAVATVAQLAPRLEIKPPSAEAAAVTADQIAKAEAANPQLQMEMEALKQREDQLIGRLRVGIEAAAVQLQACREALTTADRYLQNLVQESQPEEVAGQLSTVRDSLKTWDHALGDLDSQWRTQAVALNAPGTPDPLAAQSALEKAARAFIKAVTAANDALGKATQAIGQGQDQTTKRLVLRNALVKQLAPVTSAQEAVLIAARSAILADNVELTAIVQRLDALHKQVGQRRAQLTAALRQERLTRLQQDQAAQVAQARQEHDQLSRRITRLDADLLELGEQATRSASGAAQQARALAQHVGLQQAHAQDLQRLLDMHERFARDVSSRPSPPAPSYIPARVLAGPPSSPSLQTALLIGISPAVACGLFLLVAWLVLSARQSRQTIEDYARSLKDIARGERTNPEC